jgi:hypothetical protein
LHCTSLTSSASAESRRPHLQTRRSRRRNASQHLDLDLFLLPLRPVRQLSVKSSVDADVTKWMQVLSREVSEVSGGQA